MNLLVIAVIVLLIIMMSRDPKSNRSCGRRRKDEPDLGRIEELTHRVNVLEEILLDRDRRFRDKFGDL